MSAEGTKLAAEIATGAGLEIGTRALHLHRAHVHGGALLGQWAVGGAVAAAPLVVAAAPFVAAAAVGAAVGAGVGYGATKLWEWITE